MLTIKDVRAKFPQYGDLSDDQLADALHRRYYSDMAPDAFRQKIGMGGDPSIVVPFEPFDGAKYKPRDNGDGSFSTELEITNDAPDGGAWNIPSLWYRKDNGKSVELPPEQAQALAMRYEAATGKRFPRFTTVDEAVSTAKKRSAAGGAGVSPLATAPSSSPADSLSIPVPTDAPTSIPHASSPTESGFADELAGLMSPPPPPAMRTEAMPPSKGPNTASLQDQATVAGLRNDLAQKPEPHAARAEPSAPDPFVGESFGDLAKRRGQEVAQGAGEVFANNWEGLGAMTGRAMRTPQSQRGAADMAANYEATIGDIKSRLQDPSLDQNTRTFLEQNLADLTQGLDRLRPISAGQGMPPEMMQEFSDKAASVRQTVTDTFGSAPADTSFWSKMAQGAGSMGAFLATTLGGAAVGGPAGGVGMTAAAGATSNAGQVYTEAKASGADENTALDASGWAFLIGSTEAVPIGRALHYLPSGLRDRVSGWLSRRVGEIVLDAGEEGAQEYLSQVANNILAQQYYDPERGWTDGAAESGIIGAILGGGVGAAVNVLPGEKDKPEDAASPSQSPENAQQAGTVPPVISPQTEAPVVPPSAPQMGAAPAPDAPAAGPETDHIVATGKMVPPAQTKGAMTRAEAEADPQRFEVLPEIEGVGGEAKPTGNFVAFDKTSGRIIPLEENPAAEQGQPGGGDSAGPQPSADGAVGGTGISSAAAQPVPAPSVEADIAAAMNNPAPAAPAPAPKAARREPVPAPAPESQAPAQAQPADIPSRKIKSDTVKTPTGTPVDVDYAVVDLESLKASNFDDGRINPNYPQERQPRDRTDGKSQMQIERILRDFDPRQLDMSPTTDNGAPIIDRSGIVESGNGRTMMLTRMYSTRPDLAKAYRNHLVSQGYPVDGIKHPVLVRIRTTEMDAQQIGAYTRDSNTDSKLTMSDTEQAMADATALPAPAVELFRGGDLDSAANRDFVRGFVQAVIPENEQGSMVDKATGALNQKLLRRMQGALLAKAYGNPELVQKLIESSENSIKAIGGALMDVAPAWARMRASVAGGQVALEMDQTGALLEAVFLVNRARTEGRNVIEFVKQPDLLSGDGISPMGQRFLALMFRDTRQWTKPAGRDRIVEALSFYLDEAMKTAPGVDMFGSSANPSQTLDLVRAKQESRDGKPDAQTDLFVAQTPRSDGERVRPAGADGTGQGQQGPTGEISGKRQEGSGEAAVGAASQPEPETHKAGGGQDRPEPQKPIRKQQRAQAEDTFASQIMQELAQVDDLFQNPRAEGGDLAGIFAQIDPSIQAEGKLDPTDPRAEDKGDADEILMFRTDKGRDFYVMQTKDEVWIDVSELKPGDGGSAIYAAVADYALNTKRTFIGDPAGLSATALRRRTDNMLSTALKHGTTKHIAPHPYQLSGDARLGVPALRWTEGDDLGNIQSLIDASVASLIHRVPEVADARYDFESRTFRTGEGQPITDGDLDKWARSAGGSGAARTGGNSLKRGILLNTLARAESGQRPGLLERALRQSRQLVERGGLRRTFYHANHPIVQEADAATDRIAAVMPKLRAELDRLDLKRVNLAMDTGSDWQGMFEVTGDGAMEITIAASLDPMKTLHHEVIHALRAMNLFSDAEWRALEIEAGKSWVEKHDIAARYPDLLPHEQIEEAIAEEFSEAMAAKRAPKGSAIIRAFNNIAKFLKALANVLRGAGYQTAEDVFGRILAGEISKRQAGNTGERAAMGQRKQQLRIPSRQTRAHLATTMGGESAFIPDRRMWEELSEAGKPIWEKIGGAGGAVSDAIDRARFAIQDRFLPLLRAQQAVIRATGKPLTPDQNAYLAETTFSGRVGRRLFEIDEEVVRPIIDMIAETNGDLTVDQVGQWLYARHAEERNQQIAAINDQMPDGGSGMTNAEAQKVLRDSAAGPHAARLEKIGAMIDALREKTIDMRLDAGLITEAEAEVWRKSYKHYVPLKGFAETDHSEAALDATGIGRRFSIRGEEAKRALGRKSEAFNPLQAAITQAQEVAIRAEKNRVANAVFELAKSYPSKGLWEVKPVVEKRYFNKTSGMVETRAEHPISMMLQPNEMAVKVAGKEHRIILRDERLAEAIGNMGADQLQGVVKVLGPFSRFFSAVNTSLSPAFVIKNAIRDFTSAQINMAALKESEAAGFTLTPKQRAAIMAGMARDWRKAFMGVMRGQGYKFDTEWGKHFDEFQKSGAQVWFWRMEDPKAAKSGMEKRVRLATGGAAVRAAKNLTTPSAFFSSEHNVVLGAVERVNMAVDNAIRLAAFVAARKQGLTADQAAFLSKELTTNFNRRGKYGAALNAVFPFFNAAVQGSTRLLQALSNWKMAVGLTLGGAGLGMILDLVNAALSDDDEDGEKLYDKIPDYRNRTNQHIVSGNGSTAWAIPLPYGYNIFMYGGQQLGKVMRGVKDGDDAFADVAVATAESYMPTDSLVPGVLQPIVEVWRNKNFFGSAIYPDKWGDDNFLPEAANYFPSASEASKWLAMAMNKATGGNELESGLIDISPEIIDHYMAFVTGGAGRFWGQNFDNLAKVLQGKTGEIETKNIPFVGVVRSEVSPWIDKDRFKKFGAEVEDAAYDLEHAESKGLSIKDLDPIKSKIAALEPDYQRAKREIKGTGEFNPNNKGKGGKYKFERESRDERAIMLEFNKKFLEAVGPRAE